MMKTHQNFILFSLVTFFLSIASTKCAHHASQNIASCFTQVCNDHDTIKRHVKFPFWIRNDSLPKTCGYPRFDLLCDGVDRLQVDLPSAGVFSVQSIDYVNQQVYLNDPNHCLIQKFLTLNISKFDFSPFKPVQEQVYWLYNCTSDRIDALGTSISRIECLSGSNFSIVASSSVITNNTTLQMCREIRPIKVPIGSQPKEGLFSSFTHNIRVIWMEPDCGDCYKRHGKCGLEDGPSLEIHCFDPRHHRASREAVLTISLVLSAPFGLACLYVTIRTIRATRASRRSQIGTDNEQLREPNGLDSSTIESYPKVVLGESRRIPKMDDQSCPICLGEYQPKETVRTMPDCSHSFHVECIDEWLLLNASCPVCRNNPPNTPRISVDGV